MYVTRENYENDKKYQTIAEYEVTTDFRPGSLIKDGFLSLDTNGILKIGDGYAWGTTASAGVIADTHCNARALLVYTALSDLGQNPSPDLTPTGRLEYVDRLKWQLLRTVDIPTKLHPTEVAEYRFITLHTNGNLQIRQGYCWDGATFMRDSEQNMSGALVHDALYELLRNSALPLGTENDWQLAADKELLRIFTEDTNWVKAVFVFIFANFARFVPFANMAKSERRRTVYIADSSTVDTEPVSG